MRNLSMVPIVLLMIVFSPEVVGTCSCVGGVLNIARSLESFERAFVGYCSSVSVDTVFYRRRKPIQYVDYRLVSTSQFIVRSGVKKCKKGDTIVVRSAIESDLCGVHFDPGTTYCVFGSDTKMLSRYGMADTTKYILEVNKCSATQVASRRVIDTLQNLIKKRILLPK